MKTPADHPSTHYDRVTSAWQLILGDDLHYGLFTETEESLASATEELSKLMARRAEVSNGQSVLDVGCGIGSPAFYLAKQFDCRVVGISTSQYGLGQATERASRAGLSDKVRFQLADGTDNKLADASFNVAWVLESSHLMDAKDRLLTECFRTLRPGGKLVLCDIVHRIDVSIDMVIQHAKKFDVLRKVFGRARMIKLEEYCDLAGRAGFEDIFAEDLSQATLPTFRRWRENAAQNKLEVVRRFGAESWQDFVESCHILEGFWNSNVLGYGLVTAKRPVTEASDPLTSAPVR